MKRIHAVTLLTCLAVLLAATLLTGYWTRAPESRTVRVGFIYSEDESTPYTANFVQAQRMLAEEYGDRIEIISRSNVLSRGSERPLQELIREGCNIIFVNMDTDTPVTAARENPEVTFCQVSLPDVSIEGTPENYHTFNGEIYQARYVSGIVAGCKLREMIDSGELDARDALVGFVAANGTAEVISGYTAFLLGVRSVAPEAVMRVRTTGSWSNYSAEKDAAKQLIDEGCVIIAQHVNTAGSAVACEEAVSEGKRVYHVGYHQSMMDVAPSCALVSIRTNWAPYMIQAVGAVLNGKAVEESVSANAHGRDMSAGFESGWVELLDLNEFLEAEGTRSRVSQAVEDLKKGRIQVFSGDYTGVHPRNAADTIDLKDGYTENQFSSNPSFNYILKDYIIVEN
ncbi:MAG: BMP family ABC transporter substrate-binding protein [Clostridia bacterium]|nr:BMP family ABC transporter substrate-binding protein [Clostridia bacterium]